MKFSLIEGFRCITIRGEVIERIGVRAGRGAGIGKEEVAEEDDLRKRARIFVDLVYSDPSVKSSFQTNPTCQ
jgi:hypothetical protein